MSAVFLYNITHTFFPDCNKMCNKIQTFLLIFLIITTDIVVGKVNKTKANKKPSALKEKSDTERVKRSLNDDDDRPFWSNRGKKQSGDDQNYYNTKYDHDYDNSQKFAKSNDKILKDEPFWGNRGRRENSMENLFGYPLEYPEFFEKYCEHCVDYPQSPDENRNLERRYDLISPFWGSRGRRNSMEIEGPEDDPFWGNRGRRQEQEPFWGNRGRRQENEPFWGNRGRRDDMDPFWGNRGRRDDSEPFWGNRGRREESEPFWGNRGRRQSDEPFWGNRGRRKLSDPNWVRNRKQDLKKSILNAISDVENDIENLSRLKKSNVDPNSFWAGRGRDNKLAILFNTSSRGRTGSPKTGRSPGKTSEPGTVLDNRIMGQGVRDRRGAIEEIVKSVRNDPYFIARGKKKSDGLNNNNPTLRSEEYLKAKELICAAVDLIVIRAENGKVKREINDNDRDRRTILKKLAAQLQMDPYFVSRGKKNQVTGDKDYLQEFISNVAEKCD
ncbi:uncharacterized protein LOC113499362 isoform X2 [Trichoplusia ni]|uniref:Uncharacterized protein LOC113499362 isoform X2 n=1 Tax=Trichoplusia ni TaxID=7111 RepID=A0A7E5W4R6_TRINI|nr:uncharacterized protein LOC113499362 isoform X2 [Trichoplusia ni]